VQAYPRQYNEIGSHDDRSVSNQFTYTVFGHDKIKISPDRAPRGTVYNKFSRYRLRPRVYTVTIVPTRCDWGRG